MLHTPTGYARTLAKIQGLDLMTKILFERPKIIAINAHQENPWHSHVYTVYLQALVSGGDIKREMLAINACALLCSHLECVNRARNLPTCIFDGFPTLHCQQLCDFL
jgi:hypothetical protein